MHVRLDHEEAWSLMSHIVAQVLDSVDLSADGVEAVKKWRNDHSEKSHAMKALEESMNAAIAGNGS